MDTTPDGPTDLLVVDDEEPLADLYADWLGDRYRVETAYSGDQALSAVDSGFDAMLLDRRMPDRSGDEVLEAVRDRGIDCRVVMVTAVEPDLDVASMPFDDYLVKPVSRDRLADTVEQVLVADAYDDRLTEYFSLVRRRSLLADQHPPDVLEASEEFATLSERIETVEETLDDHHEQLGGEAYRHLFDAATNPSGGDVSRNPGDAGLGTDDGA